MDSNGVATASKISVAPRFWQFGPGLTIVGFTFALQFVAVGSAYYAFGVYLKHLPELLDTSRFYVSLAMTLQTIVMGLLSPAIGRALAERSLRGLLLVGCVLMSSGFWLLSWSSELWHVYIAFGLVVSTGMTLLGALPSNTLVANWFAKHRGTALGISQFGLTISGAALVPLTTWLVLQEGLVFTFRVYAIAIPVLLVPLILKFAIKTPEEVGLHPDGIAPAPSDDDGPETQGLLGADSQAGAPSEAGAPWTVKRALGSRNIWLLALAIGPSFLAIGTVLITLPAYGTDIGLTDMQAAGVVFFATLLGAFAKPLFGTLTDYFNSKLVVACSLVLQTLGIAFLLIADGYFWLALSGLCFGLGYGGMATLWAVLVGELFGRLSFSRVMGAMSPMIMPFNVAGLPIANLVFERTGSYAPAYAALLVGYVLAFAALWKLPNGPSE